MPKCPHPSVSVNPQTNLYVCGQCGAPLPVNTTVDTKGNPIPKDDR